MPRSAAPLRRFLLERSPEDGVPRLTDDDARHALRVLRLARGDRLIGLDGRGAAWPLAIVGDELELAADGEPEREARPGEPGARLPWIEVCVAWPRAGRAEAMLERLAQLGVARVVPWITERAGPHARELTGGKRRRLERVLAEACKQCERLWIPELGEPVADFDDDAPEGLGDSKVVGPGDSRVEGLGDNRAEALGDRAADLGNRATGFDNALLDPRAERGLAEWMIAGAPRTRVRFAIGPEGGLAPGETKALVARGFERVRIAPYVLRIETAAEAAVAVSAHAASASAAPASKSMRSRNDA